MPSARLNRGAERVLAGAAPTSSCVARRAICAPPARACGFDGRGRRRSIAGAAPENVLFCALTSLRAAGVNNRKSAFLLYGTTVAVSRRWTLSATTGFAVQRGRSGGIYVRTLAPPDDDETWIEMRPPRTERLVRLVVKIAWRRRFNFNENATVPPGFGARDHRRRQGRSRSLEWWLRSDV